MSSTAFTSDPPLRMTTAEFRDWVMAQPRGRFELIDGEVVAMAPERAIHNDLKTLAMLALRRATREAGLPCHTYADGMTVETADDGSFEPDAVLHCGPKLPNDAIAVPDPLVVVEVLSPKTRENDLVRKLVGYFKVPSVHHYLIVFADRRHVIHHRRRDGDGGIDTRNVVSGDIRLEPPGITITIDELYET